MQPVYIIGAGLAGLSAALTLAEQGRPSVLVSLQPSERAQSVLAEGGINAALDTMGEGDTVEDHYNDTLRGGVWLADPNAVAALTGRNVFCGCPSYLFYHGLDYDSRRELALTLLTDGEVFERMHRDLGIDYVYIGDYERGLTGCDAVFFEQHYPAVFRSGSVTIYKTN